MIREFIRFLTDTFRTRRIIFELAKSDFKSKYLGSCLGLLWAFIHPAITILIFWFVFEVGFKLQPVQNFPFVLWLMAGIIPWFMFSDSLSGSSYSVLENSYLVKKVVFRVSVLPLVKILSVLAIHLFLMGLMLAVFIFHGYYPNIHNLQFLYYLFALLVLSLGLSWLTSALIVVVRDVGQLVRMSIQFGFWLTPVFWSADILPKKYRALIYLNPVHYVVEGYRESFITDVWFWEHPLRTIYFWVVATLIFCSGALVFRRLRPHFADVL